MNRLIASIIIIPIILLLFLSTVPLSADTDEELFDDPIVLGGWLYKSRCTRCHGDYGKDRVAEEYDNERELVEVIGESGCDISWARSAGGEFGNRELRALTGYMLEWEKNDSEPELPDLPPLLPEKEIVVGDRQKQKKQSTKPELQESGIAPALKSLIDSNEIVQGGWLFTRNCYRCHLGYEKARMGKGVSADTVHRYISEGKTSTQMKPFSRMLGGNLKNSEIKAVVSYIEAWEKAGEPLAIADELMTPPALDPAEFVPLRIQQFREVSGDSNNGAGLFSQNCRGCHGTQGEGYIGSSLQKKRWVVRSDLYFKSILKKGVPVSLMKPWDRNGGGTLSAKEIDDVVAHLLLLEADF